MRLEAPVSGPTNPDEVRAKKTLGTDDLIPGVGLGVGSWMFHWRLDTSRCPHLGDRV